MAYDWAKLWIEMLDDRKTAALPDSSWRRFVECILLAMEKNEGGLLPSVPDMAWRLRVTPETMNDDMTRLALGGLVELVDDGVWKVTNFAKRQAAMPMADRVASFREREKKKRRQPESNVTVTSQKRDSNEGVTKSYTEENRIEEKRGEENARAQATKSATIAAASPPPTVITQSIDRTPKGFNGYAAPPEPEPVKATRPEAERQAIGHLINAIVDVTGKPAKLNPDVIAFAEELYPLGYNAEQVRRGYSRHQTTGWNWYTHNWKGRDKGDMPTIKDIRDTLGAATQETQKKKKLSQLDIALGMGNGGLS